jgi:predicted MPP superfamily phosphohydrolase
MEQKSVHHVFFETLRAGCINFAVQAIRLIGYSGFGEPGAFSVETIHLKLGRLPRAFSGFRLAQISDLHMGGWMNLDRLQRVADLIIAHKPDVLAITGDFIKGRSFTKASEQGVDEFIKVFTPLGASIPTFAVLGNHDYTTNPQAVRGMLRRCGIVDLTNTVFTLMRANEKLHLCGVDDIRHGDVRLNDVIAELEENSAAILLAHEPDFADTSAPTGKFDLQISGHTHGGQIVIPRFGPLVLPDSGRRYPSGLYKVGEMFQYTNRGVGMDTVAIRLNCPPEITIFVLESIDSSSIG